MKEVVFSRNNWVYRFLCFMNSMYKWEPPEDICSLGRALLVQILKGLFLVGMYSLLCCFWGVMLISKYGVPLLGITVKSYKAMPWYEFFPLSLIVGAIICAVTIAVIVAICWVGYIVYDFARYLKDEYKKKRFQKRMLAGFPEEKPSAINSAYKAWKEKTCYKIRFD